MDVSNTIEKLKALFPQTDPFQETLKSFEQMDQRSPEHRKYELLVSISTQVNRYLGPFPFMEEWKNKVVAVLSEAYEKAHSKTTRKKKRHGTHE